MEAMPDLICVAIVAAFFAASAELVKRMGAQ